MSNGAPGSGAWPRRCDAARAQTCRDRLRPKPRPEVRVSRRSGGGGQVRMGLLTQAGAVLVAGGSAVGTSLLSKPLWQHEIWVLTSVIVLMGVTYEKLEHNIKKAVPKTFQPAVNAMFGELAALGFISTATFLLTHGGNSLFQQMLDGAAAFLGTNFHHMLHRYFFLGGETSFHHIVHGYVYVCVCVCVCVCVYNAII